MTRTNNLESTSPAQFVRLIAIAMTLLVEIAITEISQTAVGQQSISEASTQSILVANQDQDAIQLKRIPLTLVPKTASGVVSIRLKELHSQEEFRDLIQSVSRLKAFDRAFDQIGVSAGDVQEIMVVFKTARWARIAIQFDTAKQCQNAIDRCLKTLLKIRRKTDVNGIATWRDNAEEPTRQLTRLDELTIVVDEQNRARDAASALDEIEHPTPVWAKEWNRHQDSQLVVANQDKDFGIVKFWALGLSVDLRATPFLQAMAALFQNTRWTVAGIKLKDQIEINLAAECDSLNDAEKATQKIKQLMLMTANLIKESESAVLPNIAQSVETKQAAVKSAFKFASEFLNKAGPKVDGQRVQLSFSYPTDEAKLAVAIGVLIPALDSAKAATD